MSYSTEIESLSALAEPTRLRIAVLLSRGELCVCDLVEILSLPQSTISRHMARLRRAGLVIDRKAGKWVHYRLNELDERFSNELTNLLPLLGENDPYRADLIRLSAKKKNGASCAKQEEETIGGDGNE